MSGAVTVARRVGTWEVPRVKFDPSFFLELFSTCFLLALFYRWANWVAPQVGLYLTANLGLFAYSYFALARAVYIRNQSCDPAGNHVPSRQAKAIQDYNRLAKARWRPLLRRAGPVLGLVAVGIDLLTRNMQWQMKGVLEVPFLIVALAVWIAFAPRFIIACAGWTPVADLDLSAARSLMRLRAMFVRLSFVAMAGVIALFGIGATQLVNGPILGLVATYLPNALAWHAAAVAIFTAAAWFSLSGQATWSQWIRPTLVAASREVERSGKAG